MSQTCKKISYLEMFIIQYKKSSKDKLKPLKF